MKAVVFPSLLRAANRSISSNEILRVGERDPYTFAVLADPQPGLLERYVEKRPKPYRWDREISLTEHAIQLLNRVKPKPKFVVVCGDLVDANAFSEYREAQTLSLLNAFSKLDPSIRLVTVPGNHDVGDFPTKETVLDHVQTWGDDYYSFQVNRTKFLVLNSQYMWNDTKCKPFGDKFNEWLDDQLRSLELRRSSLSIVFQHIPFFINEPNEPDDYFNLPIRTRLSMLSRLYDAGARYVFTGHLHRNMMTLWTPSKQSDPNPLHLITTSSVSVPLGPDPPGIRLVQVSDTDTVQHTYWPLDQLQSLLDNGDQPTFEQ